VTIRTVIEFHNQAETSQQISRSINTLQLGIEAAAERSAEYVRSSGNLNRVVKRGLQRPENPSRNSPTKTGRLEDAYAESIKTFKESGYGGGRKIGIGIGKISDLNRIAAHWRAIELGSDHLVGGGYVAVAFGDRGAGGQLVNQSVPQESSFRSDPDALVFHRGRMSQNRGLNASGPGGAIIRKPITAHKYLNYLAGQAYRAFQSDLTETLDIILPKRR